MGKLIMLFMITFILACNTKQADPEVPRTYVLPEESGTIAFLSDTTEFNLIDKD